MKRSLCSFIGILLALFCGAAAVQAEADWTVLWYMCGSDLESLNGTGSSKLAEIAQIKPNSSVNLVIETGGAKEWKSAEMLGFRISNSALQRYQYDEKGFTLVEELPSASMADPHTLEDFIRWGTAAYPAKKYMLLLWDHGEGTSMLLDEIYEESMQSYEIGAAMQAAGTWFEMVLLDACLMSSLETAAAIAPSAHYMVASAEGERGTAYQQWMQYLYDAPYEEGTHLGRTICDTAQQRFNDMAELTFAVTDLTKIEAVKAAFADFVKEMAALLPDVRQYRIFEFITHQAESYGTTYKYMTDLGNFAILAKNAGISHETIFKLTDAIMDAVIYQVRGSDHADTQGLSFFYDLSALPEQFDAYALNCPVPEYLAFLDAIRPDWEYDSGNIVYETPPPAQYAIETKVSFPDNGAHIQLDITNGKEAVGTLGYHLFRYYESNDAFLYLGLENDIAGSWESGIFTDRWDGRWAAYQGVPLEIHPEDARDVNTLYQVPVIVYDTMDAYDPEAEINPADLSHLRLKRFYIEHGADGEPFVLYQNDGVMDGYGNVRTIRDLQGKLMSFVWSIYRVSESGLNYDSMIQSEPVSVALDFSVQDYPLQDSLYAYCYYTEDLFGQIEFAQPAIAEYDAGKVSFHDTRGWVSKEAVSQSWDRLLTFENR